MTRRRLTSLQRVKLFDAHHGVCHLCSRPIRVGEAWEVEHVTPLWLAGADAPENWNLAHKVCHAGKTSQEHSARAKSDRVRARHLGVKALSNPRRWAYGKDSPFKKRLDGTIVRRNQEGSK